MTIYARIVGDQVAELVEAPSGTALEDMFHPDLVAAMVAVPMGTEVAERWRWNGAAFSPPAPDTPPAPAVPQSITRTQGLIALLAAGITEQAIRDRIGLIADAMEREITRLRFEGGSWARESPFIAWGAAQFGLSAEQVDGLFIRAVTL